MNFSVRNRAIGVFAIAALASTVGMAQAQDAALEKDSLQMVSANSSAVNKTNGAGSERPSASALLEAAKAREDTPEYQGYRARIRRDIYKLWQPKKAYINLPVLAFNVAQDGTVSNVTVVTPSESREFDASAVKAIETAGKFELPPAPIGAPVLMNFAFDPWIPDSDLPYPEIPEEFLSTLGCLLEFTGFTYAFYLLLVSFALVCIKKFSRAIQMAFASIILAITSLALPGIIYLIFEKIGVNESNGWILVQSVTIAGVISLLSGLILPIIVALTRGKRGKQLAWVSVVTLLGSIVPLLWPVGLFLACKGPRVRKATEQIVQATVK